jgi:alpha-L-rhamnosidase
MTLLDNHDNEASYTASFETGKLSAPWEAEWITNPVYKLQRKNNPIPFVFKKIFEIKKQLKSARVYATTMGVYTLNLNGKRIGNDFLAPGYTSYTRHLQYQVYDITDMLEKDNTLTVSVAGGWAVGTFGLFRRNRNAAEKPALLGEIRLVYACGSVETICTNSGWQVTTDGPVRDASIYDGEIVDARKTLDKAVFINAVTAKMRNNPKLFATYGTLPRHIETLKPISTVSGKNGLIYDFGQNFSGVVDLKINGKAGQIITVRHAEVLMDGDLFTLPLRTAKARIEYTCRDGEQRYSPEYTYMGFRYIEICGITQNDIDVTAKVISSVTEETGSFQCSNEDINRLQENIRWGGRSNFIDIPTDCPQRDERLGWTGDIAVFASTACFNFDMGRFLEKWLLDLQAEQGKYGGIPFVVPYGDIPLRPVTAGWGDSCILVPWAMYLSSGDVTVLRHLYPTIKRFLHGVGRVARRFSFGKKKYIWSRGFSFGDWCAPNEKQGAWMRKKKWISTAYYANSCGIAARIAEILSLRDDAAHYRELRENIISAYRNVFTDGMGNIYNEFQTAYVCPLYFGMTAGTETSQYAANLARLVAEAGNHLTTGFLGTPYLLFALSDNGYVDNAYKLLLQDTCPSWLYEVKAGGTTIWERWDSLRPDGTVNLGKNIKKNIKSGGETKSAFAGGMVSFNHYANGAVGDWLYRRVAGIEPVTPGYKTFKIAPLPGGGLTWVICEKNTPYGKIVSEWYIENDIFKLNVTIPFNTQADVVLPTGEKYDAPSGQHIFTCKITE